MKKICLVSARFKPLLGGVENYVLHLAHELDKQGYFVTVLTSYIDKSTMQHEVDERIEIYRMDSLNLLGGRFPVYKFTKRNKDIINTVFSEKYDAVVVNTRFYPISLIGVLLGRKNKIKTILIEHGTGHFTINNRVFDWLGHMYEHIISFFIKNNCKMFFGVSQSCNNWLKHFRINSIGTLYNSVDIQYIDSAISDLNLEWLYKKIDYKEGDFIVAYSGRLIAEKGLEKLINAFNIILKDFPNAKLCVAGDGPLLERYSNVSCKNVYFLGRLSNKNVLQMLSRSMVFAFPSDYPEGLPTVLLEAAACKCFIITSNCGGAKDLIPNDNMGIVLSDNNEEQIIKSLLFVVNNTQYRENAVEELYRRVKNNFTWSDTAKKLIDQIDEGD